MDWLGEQASTLLFPSAFTNKTKETASFETVSFCAVGESRTFENEPSTEFSIFIVTY